VAFLMVAMSVPVLAQDAEESAAPAEEPAAPAALKVVTPDELVISDAAPIIGNGKKQFGWANGLNENTIIIGMQNAMRDFAAEYGYEVLLDTGINSDIQPMIQAMQTWITAGVPAITVIPFQPSAFAPLAEQAIDGGLAWISYGQNMEPRHAQIAFPPCDAAVLVRDAAVKWINENAPDAKVLITSSPKIPEVACKWEGAQQAVEEQTEATVVAVQEATNQQQGLQVTEAILQAHPDLRVVIATNDDAAVGASQAFKAAGIDPAEVFIIGYDGLKEALEQIRDGGYIKADAALNLKRLAENVAKTNIWIAQNGIPEEPFVVNEPPVLVMQGDPLVEELIAFYGE
jgi:ABC-type sugar transport system substrate-binding protein